MNLSFAVFVSLVSYILVPFCVSVWSCFQMPIWCINQVILANSEARKYISSIPSFPYIFFLPFGIICCLYLFLRKVVSCCAKKKIYPRSTWVISHLHLSVNFSHHGSPPKGTCMWTFWWHNKLSCLLKQPDLNFFMFFFLRRKWPSSYCILPWPTMRSSASSVQGVPAEAEQQEGWAHSQLCDSPRQLGRQYGMGVGRAVMRSTPLLSQRSISGSKREHLGLPHNKRWCTGPWRV